MSGPRNSQGGFALLVLLGIIGVGSVGLLLAVQAFLPTLRERNVTASGNLETAADAARFAYLRNGNFPVDLDALSNAAYLPVDGRWRIDPYGSAQELDYAVIGTGVRLRSRGADVQLGTADDIRYDVLTETQLRIRQRARLRLLRAILLRSQYRLATGMTAADQAQMRAAQNDYAKAQRDLLDADAVTRATLLAQMAIDATTIVGLTTAYAMPPLPPTVTGAGGLMSELGTSDSRAYDGGGSPFMTDPVMGWRAVGADGTGGTNDDM